jgi:hypothetical protein
MFSNRRLSIFFGFGWCHFRRILVDFSLVLDRYQNFGVVEEAILSVVVFLACPVGLSVIAFTFSCEA